MVLSIIALFVYVFGAYAYGYLAILYLRRRPHAVASGTLTRADHQLDRVSLAMFSMCTLWFVVLATIEFRALLGGSREDDLIDLLSLEMTVLFPALIFHLFFAEARAKGQVNAGTRGWSWFLSLLYTAGATLATLFPLLIFKVVPGFALLGRTIGFSIVTMFTVSSVACLLLLRPRPKSPQPKEPTEQARLVRIERWLFGAMIVVFIGLFGMREQGTLIRLLEIGARTTPLVFMLVSVYFENRIEFYDLVVKRGVLLMLTLLSIGAAASLSLGAVDALPQGAERPWLLAVVLLPVALVMPWLHDRAGLLLDRLWFGRTFTPVEAVKHVLAAMQPATDEPSLVAATESALSDIFRRRVTVRLDDDPPPDEASNVLDMRTTENTRVRFALDCSRDAAVFLSEDAALLRSLGGVFGFMLENVRLQRKRLEHEQVAQQLRLQSSRSELKALRAQINPHFLFNALNAIASLIHTDPARADAAVEQLAEVFRYTLRRSDQEWAPLDQELAFARAYLDVEQARFGKRLEYSIQSPLAAARAQVPAMLLQTLVENAVKHGISRLRGPGRIDITGTTIDGRLTLEVRDSGPGPDSAGDSPARSGESFGLRSVRDRLHGHFGSNASLDLRRENGLTIARLELPLIEDLSPLAGVAR